MPDGSFNVTKTNLDVLIAHLEEVQAAQAEGWLDPVTGKRAGFYMGSWVTGLQDHHECGTAGCIAGHSALLADPVRFWRLAAEMQEGRQTGQIARLAQNWLRINDRVGYQLFHGNDDHGRIFAFEQITVGEAIETLRRLRDTGGVDWSHAFGYERKCYGPVTHQLRGYTYVSALVPEPE